MPDTRRLVRERIASLHLDAATEASVTEELAQHLDDRCREWRAGGATEDEVTARAAAELEDMCGLQAELGRSRRLPTADPVPVGGASRGSRLADLSRDLRYAARIVRTNPFFVLFVVLTLGAGIGASTTVFTVINTLILNPLPVPHSAQLAGVVGAQSKTLSKSNAALPLSYPDLKDYMARNQVFSMLAGYTYPQIVTRATGSGSERMFAELVTGNYFATLDLKPARGRFFRVDEDSAPGAYPVAVMNYATWQTRFGADTDIVGRTLRLNNIVFTIVGVAPRRFIGVNGIFGPDLWIPAAMAERLLPGEMAGALEDRAKTAFSGVGRLRPGITRVKAGADIAAIGDALAREYPTADEGRTAVVRGLADVMFGSGNSFSGRASLLVGSAVLLLVVGIVLLIACSNVANLLIARAAARRQEIAVRLAMGASRARLVRQLLTESVSLGLLSGLAGFLMGYEGLRTLWSLLPPDVSANLVQPKLDAAVFLFALVVSLATGLVFGAVPAFRASAIQAAEALKEESHTAGRSRRRVTFANVLLVGQVTFSFVSLVTAALFLRSIERAYQIDPGFQTRHLAVFLTNPGQAGYAKPEVQAFYKEVRERVSAMPGVASASWASNLPLWGRVVTGLQVEGRAPQSKADAITSMMNTVDVDYFETAGVAIEQGREFNAMDRAGSAPVAIVNQKLARDYWPGQDALGKYIQLPGESAQRTVVGVARNADYSALGEPPQPCVYVPLEQNYSGGMVLYVRSKGDPESVFVPVQQEVRAAAPRVAVNDVRSGRKIVDQALFGARVGVALLSVFGLLALGLASVGLYGIMAYAVARRRQEIGVRMALGADPRAVLRLVLRQGMSLVLVGLSIGLAAALAMGRLLSQMLYGVSAGDPLSIAAAAVVLLVAALAACYLPARAASRLDPLAALREA